MKGVVMKALCVLLSAVASSRELESRMDAFDFTFVKEPFSLVWAYDVRTFMAVLTDEWGKSLCTGIFYRRDALITNKKCLSSNIDPQVVLPLNMGNDSPIPRVCGHDLYRSLGGITMAPVESPIYNLGQYKLGDPRELFYFDIIPERVNVISLGWYVKNEERKVGVKIGLYEGLIDGLMFVTQNALSECYTSQKGDPIFYQGKIVGVYDSVLEENTNVELAVYKRIRNSTQWFN